ncbi:MAG: hypothetical protein OXH57_06155 [Ekhidna sp.]|nr:hypothetical protein [Ekhidna sp.]
MTIFDFQTLIQHLPVRKQCFTTKRRTWKKFEKESSEYKKINDQLFNGEDSLTISREDIFQTKDVQQLILKTIYWGYPSGMRGSAFWGIICRLDNLTTIFTHLSNKKQTFDELKKQLGLNSITGLRLSTYSKILYFLKIEFDGCPCLILDSRLTDVFNAEVFKEFDRFKDINYHNAPDHYLDYLQCLHDLAEKLKTNGDHIEQFLFTFGKHLK